MTSTKCGRVGCLFPIQSASISCGSCSRAFHPECSNLTPDDFAKRSSSNSGVWCCLSCLACEEAIAKDIAVTSSVGECENLVEKRSKKSTSGCIAFITGNPNKLRETLAILGEEYSDMVSTNARTTEFCCGSLALCLKSTKYVFGTGSGQL